MEDKYYYKEIKNKTFMLRHDTLDEYIAKEGCYKNVEMSPNDVWLDIGGNIGVFPVYYGSQVKAVHTYEPDKENVEILRRNLELNQITNCTVYTKAVMWDDRKVTPFYINIKKNKGMHSVFAYKGRTVVNVPCVNINRVLAHIQPTKIKMDVEGAEYALIKAVTNWYGVRALVFEYHTAVLKDFTGVQLSELYALLTPYFDIVGRSSEALERNWYHIVYCKRKGI